MCEENLRKWRHLAVMDTNQGCWIATVKEQTWILKQAKIAHLLIQLLLLLFRDKFVCEVQPATEIKAKGSERKSNMQTATTWQYRYGKSLGVVFSGLVNAEI